MPNSEQLYLSYPLTPEIQANALQLIEKMKKSENRKIYSKELINLILELTDVAVDYFFYNPVKLAKVNMIGKSAVDLALKTAKRAVGVIAGKVIGGMTDVQLLIIVDFIENVLIKKCPAQNESNEIEDIDE